MHQATVKLYFNHTASLDPVPVCGLILRPTCSKYSGQLFVNPQFKLTVNPPISQRAVTGIFRIDQLVAVYTAPSSCTTVHIVQCTLYSDIKQYSIDIATRMINGVKL